MITTGLSSRFHELPRPHASIIVAEVACNRIDEFKALRDVQLCCRAGLALYHQDGGLWEAFAELPKQFATDALTLMVGMHCQTRDVEHVVASVVLLVEGVGFVLQDPADVAAAITIYQHTLWELFELDLHLTYELRASVL